MSTHIPWLFVDASETMKNYSQESAFCFTSIWWILQTGSTSPRGPVMQCSRKTFMVHQTFVQWALYILLNFVISPIRHFGLAIGNVRHVRWFLWTLVMQSFDGNFVDCLNNVLTRNIFPIENCISVYMALVHGTVTKLSSLVQYFWNFAQTLTNTLCLVFDINSTWKFNYCITVSFTCQLCRLYLHICHMSVCLLATLQETH